MDNVMAYFPRATNDIQALIDQLEADEYRFGRDYGFLPFGEIQVECTASEAVWLKLHDFT